MAETPGKMYALASVLTILAIVAVVLRFYSRRIKKVGVSWDDYLIVLALVGLFPCDSGIWTGDLSIGFPKRSPLLPRGSACSSVGIFDRIDLRYLLT